MITDKALEFSRNQAVTTTADSTNVVDLGMTALAGSTYGDADGGKQLNLSVIMGAAATASGAATVVITLLTADDAAFSVNSTTLMSTVAYSLAQMAANTFLLQNVVPRGFRRFLKLVYTVASGPLTAGDFTSVLTFVVDTAEAAIYQHD